MKYEDPEMQVIELMARDVFVTASPGGTIIPGTGGGGDFGEDSGEDDGF